LPRAVQRLQGALQVVRHSDAPGRSAEIHAWLARWQAEAGDLDVAGAWAKDIRPRLHHNPGYFQGVELFSLLRVLVLQERLEEGLDLAVRLEALARPSHSLLRVIEARILQAEILWRLGKHADSLEQLASSLELAEPVGVARLFLDEGSRLSALMVAWQASAQPAARWNGYARWLFQCFRQEAGPSLLGSEALFQEEEIPALTGRELEVVGALVEGLSYPEIAERLVISTGTVKTHVSHIYSKLGVQGRLEAIRRAQELCIL
jgi:LuxR family maltose regulon positive regulatory protein